MKNIVLAFAFLLSTVAFAQPQGQRQGRERFNPEELSARMDAYLTKKANLTAEEAKAVLPIFKVMQRVGNISEHDMFNTLNMGIGMIAAVSSDQVDKALQVLKDNGEDAVVLGEVIKGDDGVIIE